MERLEKYFSEAEVCRPEARVVGIETESLFVDRRTQRPISFLVSQEMADDLVRSFGWEIADQSNGTFIEVRKLGYSIFYELGWNNFELVTPVYLVGDNQLFVGHNERLSELYQAAGIFGATIADDSWDGYTSNTLIMPDKRDEIWVDLDGSALSCLGHISAVHFNIDLASLDEGMEWIRYLNSFFLSAGWPPIGNGSMWRKYINESNADYEADRYGPPPEIFEEYCRKLASYKVVMDKNGNDLQIVRPAILFEDFKNADIDLFLRSVWWYPRLRVRGGKLVLEIRDVPRRLEVEESFQIIRDVLGF